MKLLLTSNGLVNQSIRNALQELAGKPLTECSLAFIPTAGDFTGNDKSWLINDFYNVKKAGFQLIDIVDIAAVPKSNWLPRLEKVDILLFGGGHAFFLLYWLEKTGLKQLLPKILESKVYVGISAGSIVTGKKIATSSMSKDLGPELGEVPTDEGHGFVDFLIRPHYTSPKFPAWTEEKLAQVAQETGMPLYAIDDETAIKVVDGNIEVITEGSYKIF